MATTVRINVPQQTPGFPDTVHGTIVSDAVAPITTTGSWTAGNAASTAQGSLAEIAAGKYYDIAGAGDSGANLRATVTGNGTNIILGKAPTTTVTNAVVTPCVWIPTGNNCPRIISVINATTGVKHEWSRGMEPGSVLTTATTGAITYSATAGITALHKGFYIAASLITASSTFIWKADV